MFWLFINVTNIRDKIKSNSEQQTKKSRGSEFMALSSKSHHHRHPSTTSNISSVSSSVSAMMKFKCSEYSNSSSTAHQNLTFQSSVDGTKEPELPLKKHRQQQNKKGAAELINNNREIHVDDCCSVSSSLSSSSLINSDFYYFANRGVDIKKLSPDSSTNETVDSGLSSDTEGFTPPPLPRRANKKAVLTTSLGSSGSKSELLMLLDDSQSDVSADSLALNDDAQTDLTSLASVNSSCDVVSSPVTSRKQQALPNNLLTEIRTKAVKLHHYQQPQSVKELGKALDSQLKLQRSKSSSVPPSRSRSLILAIPSPQQQQTTTAPSSFDPLDGYYQRFHMCEYIEIDSKNNNSNNNNNQNQPESPIDDLSFVGLKDILNVEKSGQTIRSHKSGTVRGVRNRVRAGITTFLQGKTFKVSGIHSIVATLLIYRFLLLYIPPNVFKICFNILSSFFCLLRCMGRVLSLWPSHSLYVDGWILDNETQRTQLQAGP